MKRGQITAFIIVGIVVLFSLGLAIYFINNAREQAPIGVTAEKTGVRACLQDAAEAAIEMIGARGGTASGTMIVNGGAVRPGIKAGGSYGLFNLEPLCLRNGPNRPNASLDNTNTCMPGTYQVFQPDDRVIQYALRDAIQQNAAGCEVTEPLEVVLGEDDISIVGENSSVSVPVRFKRVYNLAYQVAAKDTRDPAFDKRNPALVSGCPESDNNCVLPGLVASTQEAGDYTLVVISDNNYKLKGRPFLFMFAAEDRPPVFRGVPGGTINYDAGHELSMTVADPDENQVTVSCTGIDATVNPGTIDGIGAVTITLNSGSGDLECTATAKGRSTTIIIQVEENTAGGPGPIL